MVSRVTRKLKQVKNEAINADIVVEGFEEEREKFFKKFVTKLQFMQEASDELSDHLVSQKWDSFEFDEVCEKLNKKIKELFDEVKSIIESKSLKKSDLDMFRVKHETLIILKKHLKVRHTKQNLLIHLFF